MKILHELAPEAFAVSVPENPCSHWSNGKHIIAAGGECRCGKTFVLAEKEVVE